MTLKNAIVGRNKNLSSKGECCVKSQGGSEVGSRGSKEWGPEENCARPTVHFHFFTISISI
jgi:hypothetical protein